MTPVLQSAFLKALGWSLIDSLWQMGVVWVLYLAITRSGRKFTAEIRHNLALLSLAAGSVWFVFTLIYNTVSGHLKTSSGSSFGALGQVPERFELVLPWISMAYLAMAIILMVRLYRQLAYTGKLATRGLRKADPEIRVFLQQLAGQMGIKKDIRVWISDFVETPLTVGFWKPVILLPVSIVNNLSVKQTESIILHELYHIQRNDFLMNLLIAVADIILFFNPFASFFKDIIQKEREHRCDDMVIQYRYDASMYAQALLILEKQRPGRVKDATSLSRKISIAATGTTKMLLLARVKRLLTGETIATPVSHRLIAYLFTALFIGYLGYTGPDNVLSKNQAPAFAGMERLQTLRPGSNEQIAQIFATPALPSFEPGTRPVADKTPNALPGEGKSYKPASAYQNEEINIEKDLAQVLITEKVEELIIERTRTSYPEYVNAEKALEYSISITDPKEVTPTPVQDLETADKPFPYVPGSSFLFKELKDTIRTGEQDITDYEQLERALAAIDQMDWASIENNLAESGEDLDIERLQLELKKAVMEIDWKSLGSDLSKGKKESLVQARKYRAQLVDKYQKLETARTKKAHQIRIAEAQQSAECQKPAKSATRQKLSVRKKVVDI